jgi:hypothetical protein
MEQADQGDAPASVIGGVGGPEAAFIALHEEIFALRDERTRVAASADSLRRQKAALEKQLAALTRAGDASKRHLASLEQRLKSCEAKTNATRIRAEAAEKAVSVAETKHQQTENKHQQTLARLEVLDAKCTAAEMRAEAAERIAEDESKRCSKLQSLSATFRDKAQSFKQELLASRSRVSAAAEELRRVASMNSTDVHRLFSFDDEEVRCMSTRVMQHLICPTDVAYLRVLFRVPSDGADTQVRRNLMERTMQPAGPSSSIQQFCHASSPLWRRLRFGLLSFWKMSHWDALRMPPSVLHALLTVFVDFMGEYTAIGGTQRDGPSDEDAERQLFDGSRQLDGTRRLLCEKHAIGQYLLLNVDRHVSEGAKAIVTTLVLMAHDAGTPWAETVSASVDKDDADDSHLQQLLSDSEANGWLERNHGVYSFDSGETVTYRYVHPPDEFTPAGVVGLTLQELYEKVRQQRLDSAHRQREAADKDAPVPRNSWMHDCKLLVRQASEMMGSVVDREFGKMEPGRQRDGFLCRMLAQLALVTPRLSVTDFIVSYRSMMLSSYHHSVLRAAYKHVSGHALPSEDVAYDPERPAMDADDKRVAASRGLSGPRSVFKVSVARSPSEAVAAVAAAEESTLPGSFSLPTVGMPACCVRPPADCIYQVVLARCLMPTPILVQRQYIALEISRQLQVRLYVNFTDEPEPGELADFEEWQQIMEAYGKTGVTAEEAIRMMPVSVDTPSAPRFVFAYSRGFFAGLRVHALVFCPRALVVDVDLPAAASDFVQMGRVALGAMISMRRPEIGMGGSVSWTDLFYPPRQGGEALMIELVGALYTTLHSDLILRVYT